MLNNELELLPDALRDKQGREQARKMLALTTYADCESIEVAARASGCPPAMVRKWIESPENQQVIADCRTALRMAMANRYLQIMHVATSKLLTRLELGDAKLLRDGSVVMLPVCARDLASIALVASERHAVLTGNISENAMQDKHLQSLAQRILAVSTARLTETYGSDKAREVLANEAIKASEADTNRALQ